ncbi:decapping and exoribonuclease protein-like [Haemaphysalis longicornis]
MAFMGNGEREKLEMALGGNVGDMSAQSLEMHASAVPGDYVATLSVRDTASRSAGEFPNYSKPRLIGCYSQVGEQKRWVDGPAMLKYLRMPSRPDELHWDLNIGYEMAIRRDFLKSDMLYSLLRWLACHRHQCSPNAVVEPRPEKTFLPAQPQPQSLLAKTDFVVNRGLLARIACTPYEEVEDWRLVACRHGGTLYLCQVMTDACRLQRLNDKADPRSDRMTFWGYKFEQFMGACEPDGKPDVLEVLDENDECCIVVRSCLESHSLLMGAEVDCFDPLALQRCRFADGSSTAGYVELKTSAPCLVEYQASKFRRYKFLRWWAQCFLVGIPRVICGFRDEAGIVRCVEEFDVLEMPRESKRLWSDAVCLNFCDQVLSFIKRHVTEDNPEEFYLFQYLPSYREIVCTHLTDPGEFAFLPRWYLEPPGTKLCVCRRGKACVCSGEKRNTEA